MLPFLTFYVLRIMALKKVNRFTYAHFDIKFSSIGNCFNYFHLDLFPVINRQTPGRCGLRGIPVAGIRTEETRGKQLFNCLSSGMQVKFFNK